MHRPRIALPARFTESASALRYRGVVSARRLVEAVWAAGGDPVMLLPATGEGALDWEARLAGFDGVLMPGGGDVRPTRYGVQDGHPSLYDVDDVQDDTDFSLAAYALEHAIPTLAVCRGLHVVNSILGGTLVVDMDTYHRHHTHTVSLTEGAEQLGFTGDAVRASCYHHQCIDRLADRLTVVGRSEDGIIEAVTIDAPGWAAGLQWHPEDEYDTDPDQLLPFRRLVSEAARLRDSSRSG